MTTPQQLITTECTNGVGRVTLNRPDKRNALTREMLDELGEQLGSLSHREDIRVILLQAAGTLFCAGMDLGQMQDRAEDPNRTEAWQKDSESYHAVLTRLLDCPMPTIAVLPGPALAGGMGLVLACDMIIASESMFFALPEPRRGITAAMVTPLLLRRVGHAQAAYTLLSGQRIAGSQALTMGLCDRLVAEAELDNTVESVVTSILESSPQALATTKRFLNSFSDAKLRDDLQQAIRISADARATDDAREGLNAFLEKRRPTWAPS